MGKIKRYKNSIERFLSGESGQRFFNFAYSIGAAVVIWGALFKILHLPGGNTLLSIGMGTEVLMFILTAFDRPPKEYHWEEVFPVLSSKDPEDRPEFNGGGGIVIGGGVASSSTVSPDQARRAAGIPSNINLSEEDTTSLSESIAKMAAASDQLSRMAELTNATQQYLSQMASIADEMQRLRETTEALNRVSDVLLESYRAITENSENITRSSTGYVEQMQDLNRNIGGLNTIYEIQLKSVSSQLDSIDRVNRGIKDIRDMYEKSSAQSVRYYEETEKMTRYMQQLNSVYEKMIHAMTINMYRPMMGGDVTGTMPSASQPENDNPAV
ncbi:MAG: gliding motility protein GldL [Muribaculaceae bacterium]|nr:gliding motility protein GldL [Muribaculaceae bacterium]MBQ7851861.1 gliding motility protein GldL [Muribaculaceae bacterium]MBR1963519.1 gliding motility protein GldL [Muribaculaceae bacterium]